jgi:NAD(P)-dependent dehydrogenase (short-subunit alcohol dehydrogenase family)
VAQRVFVTAGASGIGREIVRAFGANGAKVFVCDIDSKALEALAIGSTVCSPPFATSLGRMTLIAWLLWP